MWTPRRRRVGARLSTLAALAVLLSACGQVTGGPGASDPGALETALAPGHRLVEPGEELVTAATVLQEGEAPAQLCHMVMDSYPPQCGGPEIIGDIDWDQLNNVDRASGVQWGDGWLVGTFDDAAQAFTLTRPVAAEPPQGWQPPPEQDVDFPQLCDDPGGEDGFQRESEDGSAALEELVALVESLDSYVTLYVSGGGAVVNLVVNSDAAGAEQAARDVWPGPLCVKEEPERPSEADVRAAQEALPTEGMAGSWGGGVDGLLHADVLVTDRATVQGIIEAAEPWLTPDQLRVSGMMHPLEQ